MKNLTEEQLEIILSQIRWAKNEHPKANVVYDKEEQRVIIYYPLPKDFTDLRIKSNYSKSTPLLF